MEITVRIEGLGELTEAIALLGSGLAVQKDVGEAVRDLTQVQEKVDKQRLLKEMKEVVDKPLEGDSTVEETSSSKEAYTFAQIQSCAATLARAGKREELAKTLKEFELETLMELKPDQYEDFVEKLKSVGGVI